MTEAPLFNPRDTPRLRKKLVGWYMRNRRDLPWRRTTDLYAIWVSEVMLQQTQVETVKRYFQAFLERFPTPAALAQAPEQDVMKAWSGLGYYRRARLMHRAAKLMRDQHGGAFPSTEEAIRALPGVGDYTAGALLSIGLGQPAPAVDGNVMRVLCRLLGIPARPDDPRARARVRDLCLRLVKSRQPSNVTQGLMELGALVCTPKSPACGTCPWNTHCVAHEQGLADRIPLPKLRAARQELHMALGLVVQQQRVAVERFPSDGLFGGMWGPPAATLTSARVTEAKLRQTLRHRHPGLDAGRLLARTERVLTHRLLVMWTFESRLSASARVRGETRFLPVDDMEGSPLPTAMRAALRDALAIRRPS